SKLTRERTTERIREPRRLRHSVLCLQEVSHLPKNSMSTVTSLRSAPEDSRCRRSDPKSCTNITTRRSLKSERHWRGRRAHILRHARPCDGHRPSYRLTGGRR